MPKILHFADSHIDMANYGRQDPKTGLPLRVMDFLKSLDQIMDTAIAESVDYGYFCISPQKGIIQGYPAGGVDPERDTNSCTIASMSIG